MSVKGEKYKSMKAMMKHEKNEPMAMKMKEYGKKAMVKKSAKKAMPKKMGKKK
jgi:hypothetical protein